MNQFVGDLCPIIQIIFSYLSHIEYNMPDLSLPCVLERANLPRNMIENSMFEEEPDVVDLAKDSSSSFPVRSRKWFTVTLPSELLLSEGTKALGMYIQTRTAVAVQNFFKVPGFP